MRPIFLPPAASATLAAWLALPSTAPAQQAATLDPPAAAGTITAADLDRRIGVLAHDSMRGRNTPSPELEDAAAWIAAEFRRLGLEPGAGRDGFLQRYPVRVLVADLGASSVRSSTGAGTGFGEGAIPLTVSAMRETSLEAPVVLVAGEPGPDFLADLPMEGRHVVFVGPDRRAFRVLQHAARAGAASVVFATEPGSAQWQRALSEAGGRRVLVGGEVDEGPVVLRVLDGVLGDLLGLDVARLREGLGERPHGRELDAIRLTVEQGVRVESDESAPNVVGLLPGSDPELRDEYVLFSAHMDHVGVGRPDAAGDSIYNGADDNASGTATVVEVAEAMASLATAPRRSTLFLLVSGEEKGLWGSAHWARNPTVPLEDVVAGINADMVGRNWPDTIVAIGKEHSDLGATLERVNAAHPEIGMTAIDDLWPEEDFYRRSDHFNFARRGVPILFFFNGTHEDYHRPGDEPGAIDAAKTARIGQLLFWLGLEVANADERPRWDPGSYAEIVEGGGE